MALHTQGADCFPIHHDSAPLVQWQSGRCSLTAQASPGQAPGEPFGGDPFPLPVFLPGMEGTDEHRASIIVVHYTRGRTTCQDSFASFLHCCSKVPFPLHIWYLWRAADTAPHRGSHQIFLPMV